MIIRNNNTKFNTSIISFDSIIREPQKLKHCLETAKKYLEGIEEVYFCFHRFDGINITNEQFLEYEKEIPKFFKNNGRFYEVPLVIHTKRTIKDYTGLLIAASSKNNDELYDFLPKVFNYYLDTYFFASKISWEDYVKQIRNYSNNDFNFIESNITDFLFSYIDSGDFVIELNSNKYDIQRVLEDFKI